jgi:type I restriction enzyme S subunit
VNPEVLLETTDPDWEFDYIDIGSVSLSDGVTHKERMNFGASPSRARKLVREGDIVVSTVRTYLKAIAAIEYADTAQVASTGFAVLRATKGTDAGFLYRVVQSNPFVEQVVTQSTGVSYPAINPSTLSNIKIPLPDIDAQKAIARFLDRETARIDQLIKRRSRFAELVLERRLAVISNVITGTSDNALWLQAVPEGWKVERAKVHFRESQKRSATGEEELLTVSHITGVTKRSEKDVYMFMAESNEGHKLVAPSDLIINTMWAWMGAMGVSSEHGLISPSYGVYTPVSDALQPAFVDLMVRSKPFVAEATRRSKGIHSSRLRLYPDAFLDMRLPIPPLETQDALLKEISARMQREDELLRNNAQAETLLREFRSALITSAVTGQIDVATWGKQGQTDRRLDEIEEAMKA